MALANLANVPSSREAMAQWSFSHAAHHRDVIRVIYQMTGENLPEYVLDPFNFSDTFDDQHQTMHNDVNRILGIGGRDLTEVDWKDEGQRTAWIWLNFQEHYQWAGILGV